MDPTHNQFMTNNKNSQVASSPRPIRKRVGLIIDGANTAAAVNAIVTAESAGVLRIWMSQPPIWPDTLTTFAAAAAKTSTVSLGHRLFQSIHVIHLF